MNYVTLFIFCVIPLLGYTQNIELKWFNEVDTATFEVSGNKKRIDKAFFKVLNRKRNRVANSDEKFSLGCSPISRKTSRLNWVATDNKKHQIISFSYGGRFAYNRYYILEYNNEELIIRELSIDGLRLKASFPKMVQFLTEKKYDSKRVY